MKKVVVGVVSRQSDTGQKEYLLVSSAKDFGEYTGYYYPPGGHVEDGEDIKVALLREVQEELNVQAHIIRQITVTPGDVPNQETHWYECTIEGQVQVDPSLRDARYFTRKEIENGRIWPATQKVFKEYVFEQSPMIDQETIATYDAGVAEIGYGDDSNDTDYSSPKITLTNSVLS